MLDEGPVLLTFAFFFLVGFARANATYWLGRGVRRGGEHTRGARYLNAPAVRRAETVVARMGAPAVTLSFLTVGIQTAVNVAAGVLRMPVARYEVAAATGALAWAGIYTTIGSAVVEAWGGGAAAGWWVAAAVAASVLVVGSWAARRRLRRGAPTDAPASGAPASGASASGAADRS